MIELYSRKTALVFPEGSQRGETYQRFRVHLERT
jgi:hypothetical protein